LIAEVNYAELGLRVKELRIAQQLTQEQLAELVGCNTSHISNIENNYTKASLNVLLAIANNLNTSVDSLLADQSEDSSDLLMKEIIESVKVLNVESKQKLLSIIKIIFN